MTERKINLKQWEVLAALRAKAGGGEWQVWRPIDRVSGIGLVTDFQRSDTPGYDFAMRDRALRWNELRTDELLRRLPIQPGDTLVCREAHYIEPHPSKYGMTREMIPSTWDAAVAAAGTVHYKSDPMSEWLIDGRRWSPSVHMPRSAVRLTPTVRAVRVARLQDVTEADALAAGCKPIELDRDDDCGNGWTEYWYAGGFREAWKSTTPGIWDANPWMWVADVVFGEGKR